MYYQHKWYCPKCDRFIEHDSPCFDCGRTPRHMAAARSPQASEQAMPRTA